MKAAAEQLVAEKAAAEKLAAENAAAEEVKAAEVATTSQMPTSGYLPVLSPCTASVSPLGKEFTPLPLCHYCCHRGSGKAPVHYYLQCLCPDKVCSCRCYCSDEQLKLRKQFYPEGCSDGNPVDPRDRPLAQAVAEARAVKQYCYRPCDSENCVTPLF